MNNTIIIDLTGEYSVNIGAKYVQNFRMFDSSRDLESGFIGLCQVRSNATSDTVILSPTISIISSDIFQMSILPTDYPVDVESGSYQYDIRFSKGTDVFFPVSGKFQLIERITKVV